MGGPPTLLHRKAYTRASLYQSGQLHGAVTRVLNPLFTPTLYGLGSHSNGSAVTGCHDRNTECRLPSPSSSSLNFYHELEEAALLSEFPGKGLETFDEQQQYDTAPLAECLWAAQRRLRKVLGTQ